MIEGMHLAPIGEGNILLEPGEGLDPADHDAYLMPVLEYLQKRQAQRLIYDLKNVRVIDSVYYEWLIALNAICRISGIELVAVNMRPSAAYALSVMVKEPPPFTCALDIDDVRKRIQEENDLEYPVEDDEVPTYTTDN